MSEQKGFNTFKKIERTNEVKRFFGVLLSRKVVLLSAIVILVLILVAIFAPWIAPHNPNRQNLAHTLEQPSSRFLLGTDPLGRDVLSRIIYGSRVSLMVGIIAVGTGAALGIVLGLFAGYFGGWINTIIMRTIDTLMAIPGLVLALSIAALLGGGLLNIIVALSVAMIPSFTRLMCGQVLSCKEADYILAARSLGSNYLRIMFLHILPNCFPPLIVMITINLGIAILAEAGLSFLGVGIRPPGAAWGSMISYGQNFLLSNPLLSIAPGICVTLVVLSYNILGDGLRDALDPRLRGKL